MTHDRVIRFGVLGCGGIGRWHARNILNLPGLELAAVADAVESSRTECANKFKVPDYRSLADMLQEAKPDVVCLCTPPATRLSLIQEAARYGVHILAEKPLALTAAEASQVVAACERTGVLLGVMHQQRTKSACLLVKSLLEQKLLGIPCSISARLAWSSTARGSGWRGRAPGGGVLHDKAIHMLDLLCWFFGPARAVTGVASHAALHQEQEDSAHAILFFDKDVHAALSISMAANNWRDDITVDLSGTLGSVRIEIRDYDHAEIASLALTDSASQRAVRWSEERIEQAIQEHQGDWRSGPVSFLPRLMHVAAGKGRGTHPFRSIRGWLRRAADRAAQREQNQPQGHAAILADMGAAVRAGRPPLVPGRAAVQSLAIIDALYQSDARQGARVEISSEWNS